MSQFGAENVRAAQMQLVFRRDPQTGLAVEGVRDGLRGEIDKVGT